MGRRPAYSSAPATSSTTSRSITAGRLVQKVSVRGQPAGTLTPRLFWASLLLHLTSWITQDLSSIY